MEGIIHIHQDKTSYDVDLKDLITIKIEPSGAEDVINAEIITGPETNNLVAQRKVSAVHDYDVYFDKILKPTFGYVDSVEKANETLSLFQERTNSKFVCYKQQRGFGRDGERVALSC